MNLISTRGGAGGGTWTFRDALFLGQAPDGGLFFPASLPPLPDPERAALANLTFPERAFVAAGHLLAGEVPDEVLRDAIHDALDFPVPLREIEPGIHMLELFHGPTHAFKDVGARFMARMMSALRDPGAPPLTILAATSGDTGGAVAHAFHALPGIRVVVLYPLGRVSPRQEAQFATLGGNVTAVAVRGTFDDCQRLVRQAFADPALNARLSLTSANSINIGRLLPQTFYYLHAWIELARTAPALRAGLFGPFGKLRQPHGRPDRASRARNVPRTLRRRDQRERRRAGLPGRSRLPSPPVGGNHLQCHGCGRSQQLPADSAPVRERWRRGYTCRGSPHP